VRSLLAVPLHGPDDAERAEQDDNTTRRAARRRVLPVESAHRFRAVVGHEPRVAAQSDLPPS